MVAWRFAYLLVSLDPYFWVKLDLARITAPTYLRAFITVSPKIQGSIAMSHLGTFA